MEGTLLITFVVFFAFFAVDLKRYKASVRTLAP